MMERMKKYPCNVARLSANSESNLGGIGDMTSVLGSAELMTFPGHNAGFLSTVLEAYNRHYNLRTGPEDWWYTIIQTVSLAIDKNAKEGNVKEFFAQHEGKKILNVQISPDIYGPDYQWLFDQISEEIANNINTPEYIDAMEADFETSTVVHQLGSKIILMKSTENYLGDSVSLLCGIPAVEMKGDEDDWLKLGSKISALRSILEPIHSAIGLHPYWWDKIEKISAKLFATYTGNPDKNWWSKIITEENFGSGEKHFRGWFMADLLNNFEATGITDAPNGLVSIPLVLSDGNVEEESLIIAGMIGYTLHKNPSRIRRETTYSVEATHGWSLFLDANSIFRQDLIDWENETFQNTD